MGKTAWIVTGGALSPEFLTNELKLCETDCLIVVDGALEVTHTLRLFPDYIVGDFDTVNQALLEYYEKDKILRHNPEKDQTDTELAVETALSLGYRQLRLFGAVGSRMDHSLANIFLLEKIKKQQADAVIYNENNKLYLKERSFFIKKEAQYGKYVSLLPLTECVKNVTLSGFKYSLSHQTFFRDTTLGISNEITEEEAAVSFSDGVFIVVESKDK
ncbi:MAG: thiamine diphosphokinase [Lachnospiraceae bacterium]|nr:thiamine diphosphokinase [Lachnospiraceae bacterium]